MSIIETKHGITSFDFGFCNGMFSRRGAPTLWVRLGRRNGPGIYIARDRRPRFSERFAGQHGIPVRPVWRIGRWTVEYMKPLGR